MIIQYLCSFSYVVVLRAIIFPKKFFFLLKPLDDRRIYLKKNLLIFSAIIGVWQTHLIKSVPVLKSFSVQEKKTLVFFFFFYWLVHFILKKINSTDSFWKNNFKIKAPAELLSGAQQHENEHSRCMCCGLQPVIWSGCLCRRSCLLSCSLIQQPAEVCLFDVTEGFIYPLFYEAHAKCFLISWWED